jgi:hypothetical protein
LVFRCHLQDVLHSTTRIINIIATTTTMMTAMATIIDVDHQHAFLSSRSPSRFQFCAAWAAPCFRDRLRVFRVLGHVLGIPDPHRKGGLRRQHDGIFLRGLLVHDFSCAITLVRKVRIVNSMGPVL